MIYYAEQSLGLSPKKLMNRQFTAQELEQTGFIGRILPAEGFHDHVLKLATDAAKFSLEALKTTKKLIRDADREQLLKVNEVEIDRLAERMVSDDAMQRLLEFVGKFHTLYINVILA
jgi:peroxisomal 3,2-trans-enoyl-CoA isomerase